MRRGLALLISLAVFAITPAVAQAEPTACEQVERSARLEVESAPFEHWTQEQKDARVAEEGARCRAETQKLEETKAAQAAALKRSEEESARSRAEELAVQESQKAEQDAAIKRREEREAAKEKQRASERRERQREQAVQLGEARRQEAKIKREWAHKPTVTLRIAQTMAARTIRNAGYEYGWVQCKGGRINRTHWECRANLFFHGLHGGMRVWGAGYKNGRPFYGTQSSRFHQIPISF